eukprot:1195409-Prorocentrum_minimum.AAC.4
MLESHPVDVKGNSVDVKGNIVDVKGNSVDVKGNSVDVKGNIVDVKGMVWMLRFTVTARVLSLSPARNSTRSCFTGLVLFAMFYIRVAPPLRAREWSASPEYSPCTYVIGPRRRNIPPPRTCLVCVAGIFPVHACDWSASPEYSPYTHVAALLGGARVARASAPVTAHDRNSGTHVCHLLCQVNIPHTRMRLVRVADIFPLYTCDRSASPEYSPSARVIETVALMCAALGVPRIASRGAPQHFTSKYPPPSISNWALGGQDPPPRNSILALGG